MRKILFVISLVIVVLISCAAKTADFGFSNMIPLKQINLSALEEDQYEFIGNVSGSAKISYEVALRFGPLDTNKSGSDMYSYVGALDLSNYRGIRNEEVARAVEQALYAMTEKAYDLGANMFTLPTYRISTTKADKTYEVEVVVSAVAIRLLDKSGEPLKNY